MPLITHEQSDPSRQRRQDTDLTPAPQRRRQSHDAPAPAAEVRGPCGGAAAAAHGGAITQAGMRVGPAGGVLLAAEHARDAAICTLRGEAGRAAHGGRGGGGIKGARGRGM